MTTTTTMSQANRMALTLLEAHARRQSADADLRSALQSVAHVCSRGHARTSGGPCALRAVRTGQGVVTFVRRVSRVLRIPRLTAPPRIRA
jgi:hypothetical protein